jgi:hypothetical protein
MRKIFTDNVDIGLNPSSIILDLKKGAIGSTFLNKLNPCDHSRHRSLKL